MCSSCAMTDSLDFGPSPRPRRLGLRQTPAAATARRNHCQPVAGGSAAFGPDAVVSCDAHAAPAPDEVQAPGPAAA